MTDKKMQILYTIKGIQPYDVLKEHVAILLVPIDKIGVALEQKTRSIQIGKFGAGMGDAPPMPPELINMLEKMAGIRKGDAERDRQIVLIEEEALFQKRGWRYGDTITATFDKLDE
jgi:hypothetical protein